MLQLLQLCTLYTFFAINFHKLQYRGALTKMAQNISRFLFKMTGICHTAAVNDLGLKVNVENYWAKGMWPTNSPDFSPFEILELSCRKRLMKLTRHSPL